MSLAVLESDDDMRERRCIVSGEILPEAQLVRFVVGPDNAIVPDVAAKLPGRGIWVGATRATLQTALRKNLFSKAARTSVKAPSDLADRVETQLAARMLSDLGLARRAGQLVLGFDNVLRALAAKTPPVALIEASDGAEDGRRKLLAAAHARGVNPMIMNCFTGAELSLALGRENVVHGGLLPGRLAERLTLDAARLEGFRSARDTDGKTGPNPVFDERHE